AVRDFWVETEGVSGSAFDDVLGGTNNARVDTFNELVNVNLITGLDRYFPGAGTGTPVAFSDGNIFAGSQIIREILIDQADEPTFGDGAIDFFSGSEGFGVLTAGDIDTAVFGDVSTAYTIELATDTNGDILLGSDSNPVLRVTHITPTAGAVNDGTDLLHNIERLQFADVTIDNPFAAVSDFAAQGALAIDNTAPAVGQIL